MLLKFHGSDWVGMVFGLISTYLLAKKKRLGFAVGVIGGIGWVTFGIITGSIPSMVANTLFIAFNCHGFFKWKKEDCEAEQNEKSPHDEGSRPKPRHA